MSIREVDERLRAWVGSLRDDVELSFAVPNEEVGDRLTVHLYLARVHPEPPASSRRVRTLGMRLDYLVAVAGEHEAAHEVIDTLLLGALEAPPLQLEVSTVEDATWQAFGLTPRPAFWMKTASRRHVEMPRAAPVKETAITWRRIGDLAGRVVDEEDRPIVNASVELSGSEARGRTDRKGHFRLAGVPVDAARPIKLRVTARERTVMFVPDSDRTPGDPLIIRFAQRES